jgi:hypothetical protein
MKFKNHKSIINNKKRKTMSSQNNGGNPNGAKVISIETTPPKLDQLKVWIIWSAILIEVE